MLKTLCEQQKAKEQASRCFVDMLLFYYVWELTVSLQLINQPAFTAVERTLH
jgi:hypothetical protein